MQYELIPVYLLAAAFVAEKALVLYRRVLADGKVTLDEVMEIVEEAEEAVGPSRRWSRMARNQPRSHPSGRNA